MDLINSPVQLSRRLEILGSHHDLKEGEQLIQMATPEEVFEALTAMASELRIRLGDDQPVCIPVKKGAMGTMDLLQRINFEMFGNVRPITISTTDGQKRLPEPRISKLPPADAVENNRVLIVDGVGDSLTTLRLAVDRVKHLCDDTSFLPPVEVIACVAVLKEGAAKVEVPELNAVAMLADKKDWVVGIGSKYATGMDLDGRFRDLAGVWHIQIKK